MVYGERPSPPWGRTTRAACTSWARALSSAGRRRPRAACAPKFLAHADAWCASDRRTRQRHGARTRRPVAIGGRAPGASPGRPRGSYDPRSAAEVRAQRRAVERPRALSERDDLCSPPERRICRRISQHQRYMLTPEWPRGVLCRPDVKTSAGPRPPRRPRSRSASWRWRSPRRPRFEHQVGELAPTIAPHWPRSSTRSASWRSPASAEVRAPGRRAGAGRSPSAAGARPVRRGDRRAGGPRRPGRRRRRLARVVALVGRPRSAGPSPVARSSSCASFAPDRRSSTRAAAATTAIEPAARARPGRGRQRAARDRDGRVLELLATDGFCRRFCGRDQ